MLQTKVNSALSPFQSIYNITQKGKLHKLKNLVSDSQRSDIMQAQNSTAVEESLMAAPFLQPPLPNPHVSSKGAVPKATAVRERLS